MLLQGDAVLLSSPRSDMLLQYLPWRVFGFGEMARGNLALWNPHLFSGRPFLGDFQSALLYPPNLVHLLLPHRLAINLTFVAHLWLAGTLVWAWGRRSGLTRPAATLAGLVGMLGAPLLLHVEGGHLTHVCTIAWTPAVLLCLDEAIRARAAAGVRAAAGWVLAAMAATALQVLAGHPQFAYYTALVSLAFAAAHVLAPSLAARPGTGSSTAFLGARAWPLLAWVGAWIGGAALAAAQVLAGVETALESSRWQTASAAFSATFSLPAENLLTLIAPHLFGGAGHAYFGRWYAWEVTVFVGGATVVLAALARGRRARLEAAIVLLALVVALGSELPVFGLVSRLIPGFLVFRAPARLAAVALPFIALLAARGYDAARQSGAPARAWLCAGLAAVGLAGLAALVSFSGAGAWSALAARLGTATVREVPASVLADPGFAAAARALMTRELLVATAGLAACAVLLAVARRRPGATHGLALLAAAELIAFAHAHRTTAPPAMPYPPVWRAAAAAAGEARVRHTREWFANQGMLWGHLDVWGYDAGVPARYASLILAIDAVAEQEGESAPRLRGALSMLRWRHLFGVTPQGQPAIVSFEDPLPRALLVDQAAVVPDRGQMLRRLTRADFEPRRQVLLETPPEPAPAAGPGPPGTVRVIASSTDSLDLDVEAARAAVLVVTDAFARGWRAAAVGEPGQPRYEVLPANVALRAVPLAAGRHRLRLEYAPPGFRAGRIVSLAALLAWTSAAVMIARRRETAHPS